MFLTRSNQLLGVAKTLHRHSSKDDRRIYKDDGKNYKDDGKNYTVATVATTECPSHGKALKSGRQQHPALLASAYI